MEERSILVPQVQPQLSASLLPECLQSLLVDKLLIALVLLFVPMDDCIATLGDFLLNALVRIFLPSSFNQGRRRLVWVCDRILRTTDTHKIKGLIL
ncbi:unnamed protein product [Microthlaspi erraticum]|uniref:Uncharacterized protein n=1 Tax=Microthlaspi erraticum TaxID=1685480 RepID=A0A6D2HN82_9BRAS|nr:unnamed protein product [Microthlaspi erraticum]